MLLDEQQRMTSLYGVCAASYLSSSVVTRRLSLKQELMEPLPPPTLPRSLPPPRMGRRATAVNPTPRLNPGQRAIKPVSTSSSSRCKDIMAGGTKNCEREKPSWLLSPWVDYEENQREHLGAVASVTTLWGLVGGNLCFAMEFCASVMRRSFSTNQFAATG